MRRTIYIGGFAGLLITAALILAQPDFDAILSGELADPVGAVLTDVFGNVGSKIITVDRADQLRVLRALAAGRGAAG